MMVEANKTAATVATNLPRALFCGPYTPVSALDHSLPLSPERASVGVPELLRGLSR